MPPVPVSGGGGVVSSVKGKKPFESDWLDRYPGYHPEARYAMSRTCVRVRARGQPLFRGPRTAQYAQSRVSGAKVQALAGAQAGKSCADDPFSAGVFQAIRGSPAFPDAVRALATGNLANYGDASPSERWLTSDLGRAALTGAATMLDAALGGFGRAQLVQVVVANRTCSEGRARQYLANAVAGGFLEISPDGVHRIAPSMRRVITRAAKTLMAAAARLDPGVAPAVGALTDPDFHRRLSLEAALASRSRPDLFNGPDKPVMLFLARDGGTRMLEQMIAAQPAPARRVLETSALSQRALAQGAFVSRTHVGRLLAEGEALGLLRHGDDGLIRLAPELSEDIERHYALIFGIARAAARAALAA